jgi:thioredoxin
MKRLVACLATLAAVAVHAADAPYDEGADAKADIRHALAEARSAHVPVLVVFGANWCPDCRVLDLAFKSGKSATLVERNFRVVKVDVGRFDHNLDVAAAYGVPVKKGIPTVAVLSPEGQVRYATQAGELADARRMGDEGIYRFFQDIAHRGMPGS